MYLPWVSDREDTVRQFFDTFQGRNPSNAGIYCRWLPPIIAASIGEDNLEQIWSKLMDLPTDSLKTSSGSLIS
jgi:hypothetical protein